MKPAGLKKVEYQKEKWGRGPWDHEPDRIEWEHAGFDCLAIRNIMGVWCGYVAVPAGHPLYRIDYNRADNFVKVHGGVTYSDKCAGHICHIPKPGRPDDVWWIGFDCGHSQDIIPAFIDMHINEIKKIVFKAQYRDIGYVRREVNRLAEQIARIQPWGGRGESESGYR